MFDPATQERFVLIHAAWFERLRSVIDEDDARLMVQALATLDPEDWEDIANYQGRITKK